MATRLGIIIPVPHIVMVKAGTVRVYETDCSFKTYSAGQGFYDPGHVVHPHIHTAHNAEPTGTVELAITDIREERQATDDRDRPEAGVVPCDSSARFGCRCARFRGRCVRFGSRGSIAIARR